MTPQTNDRDYEYFWLTLKGIIIIHVSDAVKDNINTISNELNILQKHKEYSDIAVKINLFLNENIEYICLTLLKRKDIDNLCKFSGNLRKWLTIMNKRQISVEFIEHTFLVKFIFVLITYEQDTVKFESLTDLTLEAMQIADFNKIFVYCIIYKTHSMIDLLKGYVDLEKYFIDKVEYNKNKYTKSKKLIPLIEKNTTEFFLQNKLTFETTMGIKVIL